MSSTVDIPLSYLDSHSPGNASSINISYALDLWKVNAVSPVDLKAAAERVARKWRYFAGRIAWDSARDRFVIRAPLGDLPAEYELVELSWEAYHLPPPLPFPKSSEEICTPVAWFPREWTMSHSRACGFKELEESKAPLVAIHTALFGGRQFVGFTIPHGIVDVTGFGLWLKAFNCELNGEEWTAPALELENLQDEAVERIARENEGDPRVDPGNANGPHGLVNGACARTEEVKEEVKRLEDEEDEVHGSEDSGVFIGAAVAEWLVNKVKSEVKEQTAGKAFVSSGDVLAAWLLKSSYADEPEHGQVGITNVLCSRELLSLDQIPRVNWTTTPQMIPDLPSPHSTSLADLALFNRTRLDAVRTPQHVSAWHRYFSSFRHSSPPVIFCIGPDGWLISNQAKCGAAQALDWGLGKGRGYEYRARLVSDVYQRGVFLNRMGDGWMWTGAMRPSRWESVRRELVKLESEFKEAQPLDH